MYHLLDDKELIEPKEYLNCECERCQDDYDIRDLHEVRFLNSYRLLCDDCKAREEYLNGEGLEDEIE